jgi:hypothetical protein
MIKFTKTSVTIIDMKLRQHPRKEYEEHPRKEYEVKLCAIS